MTVIDYDLEFIEYRTGWFRKRYTIDLISIALVADDGRTYYAVNSDMPVRRIRKHQWLMDNVVPSLPKGHGQARLDMPKRWLFHQADPAVKTQDRIANDVAAFIQATPDVELWANYGAYDHVRLCWLWGLMVDLPDGVPMFTHDIQQEAARLGIGWDELPKQEAGEHNALADARHNQHVRSWLAQQAAILAAPSGGPARRPTAAVIEIIERDRTTDDTPSGSVIVPNEVRLNGQPLLASADDPVIVHEISTRGNGISRVTLTLFARHVSIRAEHDKEASTHE